MVVNVFISAVTTDTLSRKEAVAWVNNLLKSHLTKVEEMASGAAYCQLTHLLFGSINLRKVKFNPRNEPDVLNNWKVLTTAWKELGVDKPVDVEKMKKGKFQDNMEFLQWFYKFFNANLTISPEEYDAVAARNGEDLPALKGSSTRPPPSTVRPIAPITTTTTRSPAVSVATVKNTPPPVAAPPAQARNGVRAPPATSAGNRPSNGNGNGEIVKELEKLKLELEETRVTCETEKTVAAEWETMAKEMERERDFYWSMLQKIEVIVTEADNLKETTVEVEQLKKVLFEAPIEGEVEEENGGDDTLERHHAEAISANLDDTETF